MGRIEHKRWLYSMYRRHRGTWWSSVFCIFRRQHSGLGRALHKSNASPPSEPYCYCRVATVRSIDRSDLAGDYVIPCNIRYMPCVQVDLATCRRPLYKFRRTTPWTGMRKVVGGRVFPGIRDIDLLLHCCNTPPKSPWTAAVAAAAHAAAPPPPSYRLHHLHHHHHRR